MNNVGTINHIAYAKRGRGRGWCLAMMRGDYRMLTTQTVEEKKRKMKMKMKMEEKMPSNTVTRVSNHVL